MNLRELAKRSVALTCAYYLFDDWRARRRWARGNYDTRSGSRHAQLSLENSLAYIEKVHADYLTYAGRSRFAGIVAEIGPGDNFGVALLMLGNGADAVHAIDRYRPRRDPSRQAAIYRALVERHGLTDCFDGPPSEQTLRGLRYYPGRPAEDFFRRTALTFDAILSRAVLEHLYDPAVALSDMLRALGPGGTMVHRIDLRDHGMFTGHHPLTFLTIPEAVYRRMTAGSGRPNRGMYPLYRHWLASSGAQGSLRITRLAGVEEEVGPAVWNELDPELKRRACRSVEKIRPSLTAPFRNWPDQDLAISGCVLVVHNSTASAQARP
jgi:SAM-dependent methyltransferase